MECETMVWSWAFWRRAEPTDKAFGSGRGAYAEPRRLEEWEAHLADAGVSDEWTPRLARRLEDLHRELGSGSAQPLIRAAAAAVDVQAEVRASVERNMRDVTEVERLLGAFSGELEKLDEVLEVLAAYAQRMRNKPAKKPRHILH
ncbi:MAG: hypothetical protein GY910_15385 [bacterium]|nr:hypothetical protein [Deltaproteobacteria bacterium]MCP4906359.1 hypothetical protein [bacterium]